jgi:hypothetical protein
VIQPSATIHLDVERQGQIVTVDVIPEGISERGRVVGKIGVAVAESKEVQREMRAFISYGFLPRVERRSLKPGINPFLAWS